LYKQYWLQLKKLFLNGTLDEHSRSGVESPGVIATISRGLHQFQVYLVVRLDRLRVPVVCLLIGINGIKKFQNNEIIDENLPEIWSPGYV
jgi:hypothetical protein